MEPTATPATRTVDPQLGVNGADARRRTAPRTSLERVHILVGAIQKLSLARDLEAIQAVVRVTARALTNCDGATFILKDGDQCFYADEDAISPLWKGSRFPLDTCISGWAMQHREPAVIEDIYADARIPHDAYRPTFVKSLAVVPIRTLDPVGAIGNYWAEPHLATTEEVDLLQALADSTAVALENIRLWGDLESVVHERTSALEARTRELEETNAGVEALLGESRQRAEDLDILAEDRRRLLGELAHEVRNPLAACDMLLDGALHDRADGGELDAELAEDLTDARRTVADALAILEGQLERSRLASGAIQPRYEDIRAGELLMALRGMARALTRGEEVELIFEDQGIPDLHTDGNMLGQILRNLLGNALKFTDRGTVSLRASYDPARGEISFAVSDSGIGIASDDQERIFSEFGQIGTAQSGRRRGTGLGLHLCQQLAGLLGGTLELESRPGVGSTFTLKIPARAPKPV